MWQIIAFSVTLKLNANGGYNISSLFVTIVSDTQLNAGNIPSGQ